MTPKTAINDLSKILTHRKQLEAIFAQEVAKINTATAKIESYLEGKSVDSVPIEFFESNPYLAWTISANKTDELMFQTYRGLESKVKELERTIKKSVDSAKEQMESIKQYAYKLLQERKSTGFTVAGFGEVSEEVKHVYKIDNLDALISEAVSQGYEGQLSVTIRANSKLMEQIKEENEGRLPPGVSETVEKSAKFLKG